MCSKHHKANNNHGQTIALNELFNMLWFIKKTNKKHHDARKEYIKQKLILEMLEYFLIARKMQNLRYTPKAMPSILKLYNKTVIDQHPTWICTDGIHMLMPYIF